MTFKILMVVDNPRREVLQRFVGCVDADDAKKKARGVFAVLHFKKVDVTDTVGKQYTAEKPAQTAEPVVSWAGPKPTF
jgi:hypothetical protein